MEIIITRLCFVRHGETDWNALQRIQGHKDLPLNTKGLEQAEATAHYFSDKPVNALYCSDLLRTQQTAKPIATAVNLPAVLQPALRERHFGRCEGLTRQELVSGFPEDAYALKDRTPGYVLPGGESLLQHQQRVFDFLEQLITEHAGKNIVVITHGGVLDLVYRRANNIALAKPRDFPIPNASINWLSICGKEWSIESWGETTHLGMNGSIDLIQKL